MTNQLEPIEPDRAASSSARLPAAYAPVEVAGFGVKPQQQGPAPLFHIAERNLLLKMADAARTAGLFAGFAAAS